MITTGHNNLVIFIHAFTLMIKYIVPERNTHLHWSRVKCRVLQKSEVWQNLLAGTLGMSALFSGLFPVQTGGKTAVAEHHQSTAVSHHLRVE